MAHTLTFDVARPTDHEAICALNYEAFVEEIPQHAPNPSKRLVDRFHHQNTYLVARDGSAVVGMLAIRAERPFSLDNKLGDLDAHLPLHRSLCEVRLLYVKPSYRSGPVFAGLMDRAMRFGRDHDYDLAVISGTTRQLRLYRHMGFIPFGPKVGSADARYQPMYLTMSRFKRDTGAAFARRGTFKRRRRSHLPPPPKSFLPGPVNIPNSVRRAFESPPRSHRSAPFLAQVREVQERLCRLTQAKDATLLMGSGTLANDVIGGQISKTGGQGVVVEDGEFGRRLGDHAARWSLPHRVFKRGWGEPWELDELGRFLDDGPAPKWLWLTLCETSTGVLHDLDGLRGLCRSRGIDLYLDAVSAVGAVPVDLGGVRMASAVSGKALGSYPGIGIVLEGPSCNPSPPQRGDRPIPRYLDLDVYRSAGSVPFTQSSNLVAALVAALRRYDAEDLFVGTARLGAWLRRELGGLGYRVIGGCDGRARAFSPAVVTIEFPPGLPAQGIADGLKAAGFHVSYESSYLLQRNWLQICLMGTLDRGSLEELVQAMDIERLIRRRNGRVLR